MPKTKRPAVVHETSSSATLEDQTSPITSSDKIKFSSNAIKTKNTKSQSKAKIINHENSSKVIENDSDEEQDFDLQLSGENSGNDTNNETLSEPENESQQSANIEETEGELSTEEINVSTGGTKRKINWKGGSKNCGVYLLYKKEEEIKECVNSTLAYARDHGTLMNGSQLKTLMDIQNVEITKDRANTIIQKKNDGSNKSSTENKTSDETIEEDLNMLDVGNVDEIIETSGVNTDYEKSNESINTTSISNKENAIQEVETFHSNSSIEIGNKRKSDVDKENSDLVTSNVLGEEVIDDNNVQSSLIESKQAHNNNIDSLNNNGHIVTKEVATPITNPVGCFTTNNTFIRSSTQLASSSSNDVPFSSNEGSSIENPHSSALSCSSSISNTPKTVPPRQSKYKNVPRKNVTTGKKSSKTYNRRSIALRSKNKMKDQQQHLSTVTSKRKQDDKYSDTASPTTPSKKKKAVDQEKSVRIYPPLSSTLSKIPKKLNKSS
ncbi:unnamed protein product [Rotaria sordida]|uniref:Uncharacterized protein n=2 Tax=Rotaria sordida TaxID=392033 RepID=A0A815MHM5_9BILA|nr:unnamed protein product [Rotaria sordida]